MSPEGVEMVESYIRSCWDKGVAVVLDPGLANSMGTYNTATNTLTLGNSALDCDVQLIETIEHEFIHVLQDELAGIENSDSSALGMPTTEYGHEMVAASYSHLNEDSQALEVEAFSVEELIDNPEESVDIEIFLG